MKRNQAISMYQTLLSIKLDKMSEDMTDAILANTLSVAEVNNSFSKAQEELRKRTIETIDKERLTAYDELQVKMNALEGVKRMAVQAVINDNYKDVQKQINRLNKAISSWLDKDVGIELQQVERKDFIKGCKDAEQNISPATIEVLAPMFKGYVKPETKIDEKELDELLAE